MTAIYLYAPNDPRGNSRNIYVVFDNKGVIQATVDEKGQGIQSLVDWANNNFVDDLHQLTSRIPSFETTPLEYQRLKNWKPAKVTPTTRRARIKLRRAS